MGGKKGELRFCGTRGKESSNRREQEDEGEEKTAYFFQYVFRKIARGRKKEKKDSFQATEENIGSHKQETKGEVKKAVASPWRERKEKPHHHPNFLFDRGKNQKGFFSRAKLHPYLRGGKEGGDCFRRGEEKKRKFFPLDEMWGEEGKKKRNKE